MKKIMSTRLWILLIALVLAFVAINPNPYREGVELKSVDKGSFGDMNGLVPGMIITNINGEEIVTLSDFNNAISKIKIDPVDIEVVSDKDTIKYNVTDSLEFNVENLTVVHSNVEGISEGDLIESINGMDLETQADFDSFVIGILPRVKFSISTDQGEFAFLSGENLGIKARNAAKNNLVKGLELEGGTRVLIKPEGENIDDQTLSDLISVLNNRLNVYGLSDVKIRSAKVGGESFVLVELAGVGKEEVEDLIGQQGKFEAKIGNETVFIGGNRDVTFVCRNDGSCSGVRECRELGSESYCNYGFSIKLSEEAAKRHAEITSKLDVITDEEGREYLSEKLDFYLDDKVVNSLNIGSDLKGSETTDIQISGSGSGATESGAYDNAIKDMESMQTILITGSLPLKIEISRIESISPVLGKEFIKNAFFVGGLALLSVGIVIFLRYRKLKIAIPMVIASLCEVVLILGVAAVIRWNLDMAAIAGIIAAVGTGVDDQIVIADEVLKSSGGEYYNWKDRIKKAFFIIMAAYATTFVAMIPLGWVGAGLVRGFAVTIIIGISIGVFLTRPAFAAVIEKLLKK